jgi:CheY-like chemotaxis protein
MNKKLKVLVIEDQSGPLDAIKFAVKRDFSKKYDVDLHVAQWYSDAEQKIKQEKYDLIFLDHRMPYNKPPCSEDEDMDKFSASLQEIGYGLMQDIQTHNSNAVIVGTSSLSPSELRRFSSPDLKLVKYKAYDDGSLEHVVKEISKKEETKKS